jgi:hypothetical protein
VHADPPTPPEDQFDFFEFPDLFAQRRFLALTGGKRCMNLKGHLSLAGYDHMCQLQPK